MAQKTEAKTEKIEREYIIPLQRKYKAVPRYKRANKAIKTIKEFLVRHMKIIDRDLKKIKIDNYLNDAVWSRGIKKPPRKIKIRAVKESGKDGEIVRVYLFEMPEKLKFKKLREEKMEKKALESSEKKKSAEEKAPGESGKKQEEGEKKTEEEKSEEKEKKSAVVESGKKIEKELAKKSRHTTKVSSPKKQKTLQKEYNKSSRGH